MGGRSMDCPKYLTWFVKEDSVVFEDGVPLECYRLDYHIDDAVFAEWALYLRQHYESDEELTESLSTTGLPVEEYLRKYVIPQKDDPFGSTSRSNDFTEIMVSDLLEFLHDYTVPRCKQNNRSGKTQSEHGTDILAYKYQTSYKKPSKKDELLAVEVKSGIASDSYAPIINAVNDSHKYDEVRHSLTLNYYRKKLRSMNKIKQANEIERFQKKSEYDYIITYIATGIISKETIADNIIAGIKGNDLQLRQNNKVFLVHGKKLMDLVHCIYERCLK